MAIDKLNRRQLQIGMADWFRPYAETATPDQINIDAGVFFNSGTKVPYLKALQSGPVHAGVAVGNYRYDLVYLKEDALPVILQGTVMALPVVPYTGAPGLGGPSIPANAFPVAYVLITEPVGAVSIVDADITDIRGVMWHPQLGLAGELLVDGVASPGSNMKRIGIDHVHPLNTDAVLPTNTTRTGPPVAGASGKYSDRAHQHQVDPTLVADVNALLAGAVTYMSRSETLEMAVDDANPTQIIRLHQFQGRMIEQGVGPAAAWANIQPGSPLSLTVGLGVGLGQADAGNPPPGADRFYYIYLIYKPSTGVFNLVYSEGNPAGTPRPPSVGPNLVHAAFAGYTHYRFLGTFFNAAAGWNIVAFRKHNNHVEYELAQIVTQPAPGAPPFDVTGDLTLSERVPPTSMRAFMCARAQGRQGSATTYLMPPFNTPAANMQRHDTPGAFRNADAKLKAHSDELGTGIGALHIARDTGWVDLDDQQNIGYRLTMGGTGSDKANEILVLGYEEFTDIEGSAHSW